MSKVVSLEDRRRDRDVNAAPRVHVELAVALKKLRSSADETEPCPVQPITTDPLRIALYEGRAAEAQMRARGYGKKRGDANGTL